MDQIPIQNLTQNDQVLVNNILAFINILKEFKYSNLAENPEILQIYQNKNQHLNQKPSVWQTFIYSIRKYREKPFDIGKSVLDIIFMIIFSPYFSQKVPDQTQNSNSLKEKWPTDGQKLTKSIKQNEKPQKKQEKMNRKSKLYEQVLKELDIKKFPQFRQWMREKSKQIKQACNPQITKEQMKALVKQIKTSTQIFTLEYIISTNWFLTFITSKQISAKCDKNFIYQVMVKHSQYIPRQSQSLEYHVWLDIKKKLYLSCTFNYSELGKVYPVKLLNLVVRLFVFLATNQQSLDLRYYMHMLHKAAEKRKNHLLADIIRSKCFLCEAERYSSNSIHKIRIYQCLSRKILNSISQEKKEKPSNQVQLSSQNQNQEKQPILFDSQGENQF